MPEKKPQPPSAPPVADEAKRRFREALERKRAHHGPSAPADPTTQQPHTAPAKPSRSFRRKSG